jgi:signal transduction histidine kinase
MANTRAKRAQKGKKVFQPISPEHAARLEAIARVTGAIAHDFNNLIMLVNGYADLLLSQTQEDDRRRVDLQAIQQAAQRAAVLTKQLLTTGRRIQMKLVPLDINAFLESQADTLREEAGEKVKLTLMLDPAGGMVRADPPQLLVAFMQLARNAREAMPQGGSFVLQTESADEEFLIHATDSGPGISPEAQERVFEPFFTTKPRSLARGLGLAMTYAIVRQTNGEIGVHSTAGGGTTISMRFPRA